MRRLFHKDDVVAVCLDMQDSMVASIYKGESLLDRATRFFKAMKVLDVPVLVTQQYTKGLGDTNASVKEAIGDFQHIEKGTFSCVKTPEFMDRLKSLGRNKIILTGMETHICILQTAMDLLDEGYDVYVLADCVSSRTKMDKKIGLQRMSAEGVKVATYESVAFEMLGKSGTDEFKAISKIVK